MLASLYQHLMGEIGLPLYEGALRGRDTFRYHREFQANQWLPAEQIAALQWRRLSALLDHAYKTVDYYRAAFDQLGIGPGDIRTPEDFARLPILGKADIRQNADRLASSAFNRENLVRSATGGSTGEPLQFRYDRTSYQRRVAAAMRGDSWAGWSLCAPEYYIWGAQLLPQSGLIRWKKMLHHALLRREIVSSFDMTEENVARHVRRYNRIRPRVVVGYTNAVYEFARLARAGGLSLRPPQGVIATAEKLYGYQRDLIEEVFGAPVFNRYGCREVMMIGAECERHNGLHVTADNLYVEIVRDGHPCEPGETGEVLLTDLHNYGMPLIRYRIGDAGSWKGKDCPCGRGLPLMNVVEGRVLDLIRTPSGRVVSGEFFPHLLKDFAAIHRYQVVQEERDKLAIRIATRGEFLASDRQLLERTIVRSVGTEMKISWEIGPDVVIEQTAKFRPVLSQVPSTCGGLA